MEEETIYVYLLEEGTDVWRPVRAVKVQDDWYRILAANPDPNDEEWQFTTGDVVRCEMQLRSNGMESQEVLVTVEKRKDGT